MVNLVLTPDEIRSAPAQVREWVRNLLATELELRIEATDHHDESAAATLAECSVDEAARILERIQNDYLGLPGVLRTRP